MTHWYILAYECLYWSWKYMTSHKVYLTYVRLCIGSDLLWIQKNPTSWIRSSGWSNRHEILHRLKHNQVGILCVTFCKKWKLFGRLFLFEKILWCMGYVRKDTVMYGVCYPNRILFSILASFFKLAFITTREMVYRHYKTICITFFHNKIYNTM